jgi:tetratricopeptide (TPR) repeat protein
MGCYRALTVFLFAGIMWMSPVTAQTSKLQQGKDHFMKGSYFKALEYFNQAISLDRSMTPEMFTEAYYYRGLTYVRLHNEAFSGENKEGQKLYKDALLSAYNDYKASLGYDNGSYWKQIDLEIKNMHHALLQEGLTSLNAYNELIYNGKADSKLLARAEDFLTAAHEIRETYLVCDLLGQVFLDKGQKKEAADYFSASERLYTEKLPEEPDFLMAYVLYRLAAIHKTDDIRLAMQDCQRGLNLLESEYGRFSELKNKLSPARVQQMEDQYTLAFQDLADLKLDLYLGSNDLYVEALHVFEEELAAHPEDIDIMIGYASLLEKSDKEKAITTYKKVLSLDPDQPIALFNLGALYYAKGKELFETSRKANDDKQFDILTGEAENYFKTARPYFERAHLEDPQSLEIIQALKTIAFVLDDQPAYLKYQEMEKRTTR